MPKLLIIDDNQLKRDLLSFLILVCKENKLSSLNEALGFIEGLYDNHKNNNK